MQNTARGMVLGGADCVWDDVLTLEALLGHQWDGVIVAVNDVGVHWPRRLDHWVTLHSMKMAGWQRSRDDYEFDGEYVTWSPDARHCHKGIRPWPGGSSGMLAVQVAMQEGCERVVLCGVPMTATPHFEESSEVHILTKQGAWAHADKHWRAWVREAPKMQGVVRSMGGRTQELLGAPTHEWLTTTKEGTWRQATAG